MNIHQLLSTSQSSPQTQTQGSLSKPDSPNGLFRQALLHASGTQDASSRHQSEQSALNSRSMTPHGEPTDKALSKALNVDIEKLTAALEALGIDISASDLADVLAKLQTPNSKIATAPLANEGLEDLSPLDAIAERLALMSSFDDQASLKVEQLTGSDALQLIAEQLNISSSDLAQAVDPATLTSIAEQLDINQTEASQLVAALNVLVGQRQADQSSVVDIARATNTIVSPAAMQVAPLPQPTTFFNQMNVGGTAPQISSEALMGALLTSEGFAKGNLAGEHTLTGFTSHANAAPLASAQQNASGFSPTVPATQAALTTPLSNPAWSQQLSQQLVQISQRGGEQHVQMQLNPAELGPLSISLKFGEQGAQAHFLSAHAQVRQILEQAIPQLREALAEQGISLGDTSVGEQRDPNAQAFAQSGSRQSSEAGSGEMGSDETPLLSSESRPLVLDGRVDLYA